MRTVTTPAAQVAAAQMGIELPALAATTTTLLGQGDTLASPENWDGPKAQVFRGQIWPDVAATLTRLQRDMTELAETIAEVNRRTAEAGS
jgi:hypothetical protein